MTMYIGFDQGKVIVASDRKEIVEETIKEQMLEHAQILETTNVVLSDSAKVDISEEYEFRCIRESVLIVLKCRRLHGDDSVIDEITADAHHDVARYGVDEDYAIDEAIGKHLNTLCADKDDDES